MLFQSLFDFHTQARQNRHVHIDGVGRCYVRAKPYEST